MWRGFEPRRRGGKPQRFCSASCRRSAKLARYAANPSPVRAVVKAWTEANKAKVLADGKAYHAANKDRINATHKAWYAVNKEKHAANGKAWREGHKDRHAANGKAWRESNKARRVATGKAHYKANKPTYIAKDAARRALKLRACPTWVDRKALKAIFEGCPEGYHVDHIHPLNGENSTGLHVPWNLQYLPDEENRSKSNHQPQPGYLDWFSEAWTVHAAPIGRVWTPTDYDNI